jgi:hypothetical protein
MELIHKKKKKTNKNPKSTYVFTAEYMIGDADGYKESEVHINAKNTKDVECLKKIIQACEKVSDMDFMGGHNEPRRNIRKHFEGTKTEIADAIKFWDENDFSEYDPIFDLTACLEGFEVKYFDEDGIEHTVSWKE